MYVEKNTDRPLDVKNQMEVTKTIYTTMKNRNLIIIASIHDINLALRYFDYILLLKDGKVCSYSKTSDITEDIISEAFDLNLGLGNIEDTKQIFYR